ncbi:outer membrane protein assembly factor [bacterium]|nr:outer membrane protein assembly factor [bacterium]
MKHQIRIVAVWLCIVTLELNGSTPLFGQSALRNEESPETIEKTPPKKMSTKETWEHIVSFPGTLINLPFKIVFAGTSELVKAASQSKIPYRIRDFLTSDDGKRGLMPTSEPRLGVGLAFYQKSLFAEESRLRLSATIGNRGRRSYLFSYKRLPLGSQKLVTDFVARHWFHSDENFFGLGPNTKKSAESNFALKQTMIEWTLGYSGSRRFSFDTLLGLEFNNIEEGRDREHPSTTDLFTDDMLPGIGVSVDLFRVQPLLTYDSKNSLANPTAGWESSLGWSFFQQTNGSRFAFWKFSADFLRYLHLFYNRTLILRLGGEITRPFSDKQIPFYYLSEIGRVGTIRGFRRGRFRDRDSLVGSMEYRYPIRLTGLDALFFLDAGQVSSNIFKRFSADDFEYGYGGGLRVWGPFGTIARFEIGNGRDGVRIYFLLNQEM